MKNAKNPLPPIGRTTIVISSDSDGEDKPLAARHTTRAIVISESDEDSVRGYPKSNNDVDMAPADGIQNPKIGASKVKAYVVFNGWSRGVFADWFVTH